MPADIAIVTERRYENPASEDWYSANILHEERLLAEALAQRGLSSKRVDWSRSDVDWSQFTAVVLRSTWDYFDRYEAFCTWLERCSSCTQVINAAELVRWNRDKHYLLDLQQAGVPTVPTVFFEQGMRIDLDEAMATAGWSEAVLKPAISGAARHTYRIRSGATKDVSATAEGLLSRESLLLQPFQRSILNHGEVTLVLFAGQVSHAVRKVAKRGDFRVQDDHGGKVLEHDPTRAEIRLAEQAMAACQSMPVYGRVDMVRANDGQLAVMELEIIEPELWLRFEAEAPTRFAQAIVAQLDGDGQTP
jgi:glutathione synthase/RimK-type ligase-like ATP-grasp enzyme